MSFSMIRRVGLIALIGGMFISTLKAQEEKSFMERGEIHGNFQAEAQYYLEDSVSYFIF